MLRKGGFFIALLISSFAAWPMTLNEAIELSIKTNPITKTLEADVGISEAGLQRLRGERKQPLVTLTFEQRAGKAEAQPWENTSTSKVEIKQLLYDFHRTKYQIDSAKAQVGTRSFMFEESKERLALLVSRAYLEVLRLDLTLNLVAENIAEYARLLETMYQREAAGVSSYSEVQKVAALLEGAKKERIRFSADRDFAVEAFTLIVGAPPYELEMPDMESWPVVDSLDELLRLAKTDYYGVKAKNLEYGSARSQLLASRRDLFPTLSFEANLSGKYSDVDDNDWSVDQSAKLVLSYNLWDGSVTRQQIRENELTLQRTDYQREEYLNNLERDVKDQWRTLQRIKEEKAANDNYLKVSEEVVQLYRQEFELGQQSLLDISTAQQDLHRSRTEDVRLYFAYFNSVLNILLYQNAVIKQVKKQ